MRKHHNKLFYGKYPYKVEFDLPGAHALWPTTDRNLEDIRNTTSDPKSDRLNELWQIAEIIMDNRKLMKFRIQEKKSIFYCEKDLAHRLIDKFWQYWKGTTEVSNQALSLRENEVICKRLPHNQYQYQVHLKKDTHRYLDQNEREALWNFLHNNEDTMMSHRHVIGYLSGSTSYCYEGYFYAKNEKSLTMIYLLAQKAVRKVVKFVKEK